MFMQTRFRISVGSYWILQMHYLVEAVNRRKILWRRLRSCMPKSGNKPWYGIFYLLPWIENKGSKGFAARRQEMIDWEHCLPVTRQCQRLDLNRSTTYYQRKSVSETDFRLMRRIDEMTLQQPFYGSRRPGLTPGEGHDINRKRVQRLMRQMGIIALYPKANTRRPGKEHTDSPYLLRSLVIDRLNQGCATDISYIPMAKDFVCVVIIKDWCSREVLAWRFSNSMDADFCVEAQEEATSHYGALETFNTDQERLSLPLRPSPASSRRQTSISMDGKGCCWVECKACPWCNVFVERLWCSL